MSTATARRPRIAESEESILNGFNPSYRIRRGGLSKKTNPPRNPTFRELTLDNLRKFVKPKNFLFVLAHTINDTPYGSDAKTRKLLIDLYEIVKHDFIKNGVKINIPDDFSPQEALHKIVFTYDQLHPDLDWEINYVDSKLTMSGIRSYEKKVPFGPYSFELYDFIKNRDKYPDVVNTLLAILSFFHENNIIYFWYNTFEHDMAIDYLKSMANDPKGNEISKKYAKSIKENVDYYENGEPSIVANEIENLGKTLADLESLLESWKRKRSKYKKQMVTILEAAIEIGMSGLKISDFVQINPDTHRHLYDNGDPFTMIDMMQCMWSDDNSHYYSEVHSYLQNRFECGVDEIGFHDKFVLTPDNYELPEISEIPRKFMEFFNTVIDVQISINEKRSTSTR